MDRRLLRRVLGYARPYRRLLWLVLATIVLSAPWWAWSRRC